MPGVRSCDLLLPCPFVVIASFKKTEIDLFPTGVFSNNFLSIRFNGPVLVQSASRPQRPLESTPPLVIVAYFEPSQRILCQSKRIRWSCFTTASERSRCPGQVLCFSPVLPFRCSRLSLHYSRVSQIVREAKRKTWPRNLSLVSSGTRHFIKITFSLDLAS